MTIIPNTYIQSILATVLSRCVYVCNVPPPPTYSVLNGGSQVPSSLDRGLLVACGDMKSRSGPSSNFYRSKFHT